MYIYKIIIIRKYYQYTLNLYDGIDDMIKRKKNNMLREQNMNENIKDKYMYYTFLAIYINGYYVDFVVEPCIESIYSV